MNKFQAALHHARQIVEQGRLTYICHALKRVGQIHPTLASAAYCVRQHIEKELRDDTPATTLEGWVACVYDDFTLLYNRHTATLARLAWIDKLIEHYGEAK